MKTILHKTFSLVLSLLVLFSTVSFTVEKHFCDNTLIDVSFFSTVESCCPEGAVNKKSEFQKQSCCKDTIDLVKGQDQLIIKKFEDLNLDQQSFFTTFAYSLLTVFEDLSQYIIPYKYYSQPHLVANIQVRNQVFLI
ncbi:HYC_CC_PP family protein [Mangrovimonas spongiae]|uniref:Transmembrane protein n=1 Tax=Mangrovimonas spongiae TaxID=2494697 RepID=A0A428K0Q4_9FLAO|nr:hypothetical protein [Mangrovimonas spongiae]RSK39943.1 hypothetical protein EJA19_08660 [Mangrovimonas spongiae]